MVMLFAVCEAGKGAVEGRRTRQGGMVERRKAMSLFIGRLCLISIMIREVVATIG